MIKAEALCYRLSCFLGIYSVGVGMPESERQPELSQDALVEALVPDPARLPDVVMLQGYLGKSGVEGTWRLYFTPDLDDYVEIPADKVLHTHRLPEDRGTMVWVPRGLVLEHKQIRSEDVQAEFLAGPITARLLRDNPNPTLWHRPLAAPYGIVVHPSWLCPTEFLCTYVNCPVVAVSHTTPCPQSVPALSCQ